MDAGASKEYRIVVLLSGSGGLRTNGTDFSEISRNTIRLARYLRNES